MSMMTFELDDKSKVLSIVFGADLVSSVYEESRKVVGDMITLFQSQQRSWSVLTLDFRPCNLVDSSGLNLIVYLIKYTRDQGGTVKATLNSRIIYRTFLFTRLDKQMEIEFIEP